MRDPTRKPTATTPPIPLTLRDTERAMAAVRVPQERQVLTIISGPQAGTVFVLRERLHVLGRGEVADFRVDDPDVSRIHVRLHRGADGRYVLEDPGSTNGTFLGEERVHRVPLAPGARIQCGARLVLRYAITDDIEQELQEQMHASAMRDGLTRVHNRRHFLERLEAEHAHAQRHGTALSLLMADVDGMARLNEAEGQAAGDVLLRAIAGRLARLVRADDSLARYGSDEFVVLARATPLASALALAHRLRVAVGEIELPSPERDLPVRTSLSFGVASLSELAKDATPTALLAVAAARLRIAKNLGRDSVCWQGGFEPESR
jgi:diguanylate cyclase (GGDEF)-like protein